MSDPYYRFYPGDYLRDTSGLSLLEHGAYNLLLHHYYSAEGEVKNEKPRLYRLCGAVLPEEQAAVDHIVNTYFPIINNKLTNKRGDTEINGRRQFIEEQIRKGRLGGRPRNNPDESRGLAPAKAERKPKPKPDESLPSPSPLPSLPLTPEPKETPLSGKPDDAPPYSEIVSFLNEKSGKNFRPASDATRTHIHARWKDGFRMDQFKAVIEKKCAEWKGDPKMDKFLRPQTLFIPSNFEAYLNEREVNGNGPGNKGVHGQNLGAGQQSTPGKYDSIPKTTIRQAE